MTTPLRDILYVDDEPNNLFVFEASFEESFRVHVARSAAEALAILDRMPIPVVVADQRMPEMTGVEMFRVLRKRFPHIQRIILSGYTDSQAIIDAVNAGQVFQFVQKPWNRSDLHAVLRRALDTHDLGAQNSLLAERLAVTDRMASLGQLAAEIAHEMGNQLSVLPLVEVIEDEYPNDAQLQELAAIARQTHEHLAALVDEIKSFVRRDTWGPDDAGARARFRPIDMGDCVRELLSFLRFHRDIPVSRIQFSEPPGSLRVAGDLLKLQQVVVNLLANAADAIAKRPTGRIELELQCAEDEVLLRVSDNGYGIAQQDLERIWDSFYSTKGERGTGLGLSVARTIIQSHDGTIHCASTPGEGTTFTIALPRLISDATGDGAEGATRIRLSGPDELDGFAASERPQERRPEAHSSSSRRA